MNLESTGTTKERHNPKREPKPAQTGTNTQKRLRQDPEDLKTTEEVKDETKANAIEEMCRNRWL